MIWRDGSQFKPPKNPLEAKWAKLYPPVPKPEYSQVCDGYSCMWCDRCPNGEDWEVPEEDKAVYAQWRSEYNTYIQSHGGLENLYVSVNLDASVLMGVLDERK